MVISLTRLLCIILCYTSFKIQKEYLGPYLAPLFGIYINILSLDPGINAPERGVHSKGVKVLHYLT